MDMSDELNLGLSWQKLINLKTLKSILIRLDINNNINIDTFINKNFVDVSKDFK